jgi:hypothetical protein
MPNHWLVRTCLVLCALCSTVTLVAKHSWSTQLTLIDRVLIAHMLVAALVDAQHILQSSTSIVCSSTVYTSIVI